MYIFFFLPYINIYICIHFPPYVYIYGEKNSREEANKERLIIWII